jgi:hypothetical protein
VRFGKAIVGTEHLKKDSQHVKHVSTDSFPGLGLKISALAVREGVSIDLPEKGSNSQ